MREEGEEEGGVRDQFLVGGKREGEGKMDIL